MARCEVAGAAAHLGELAREDGVGGVRGHQVLEPAARVRQSPGHERPVRLLEAAKQDHRVLGVLALRPLPAARLAPAR